MAIYIVYYYFSIYKKVKQIEEFSQSKVVNLFSADTIILTGEYIIYDRHNWLHYFRAIIIFIL